MPFVFSKKKRFVHVKIKLRVSTTRKPKEKSDENYFNFQKKKKNLVRLWRWCFQNNTLMSSKKLSQTINGHVLSLNVSLSKYNKSIWYMKDMRFIVSSSYLHMYTTTTNVDIFTETLDVFYVWWKWWAISLSPRKYKSIKFHVITVNIFGILKFSFSLSLSLCLSVYLQSILCVVYDKYKTRMCNG